MKDCKIDEGKLQELEVLVFDRLSDLVKTQDTSEKLYKCHSILRDFKFDPLRYRRLSAEIKVLDKTSQNQSDNSQVLTAFLNSL